MEWKFSWLRSWDSIWAPANLDHWMAAIARGAEVHATPFMHPHVIRAWLSATGGEAAHAPFFLRATHSSGQEVLWLLVRPQAKWRTGFVRKLMPVGAEFFDYHDPIVAPAASAEAVFAPGFWQAFGREMRRHQGVWFDHCALSRLRPSCFGDGSFTQASGTAAVVRLDAYPDFDAYMAARRGSINKLGRKLRKLSSTGESKFHVYGPGEREAALAWLPDLDAAHRARYPNSAIPADLLRNLVSEGLDSGVVHCSTLLLDGRAFSWHLGFHLNGAHYDYVCGFDPAYARLSPGLVHVHAMLAWLYAETDTRVFDFMLGSESYKHDWTDGEEITVRNGAIHSRALATLPRLYARRGLHLAGRAAPILRDVLPAARALIGERTPQLQDLGRQRDSD